ncbi:hypothetical protein C1Y08_27375 [Pseudomonas sp. FW306-02-F02-AA]|jgi:hypothetical protein|uniref:Uncharacterized protein n=1 Tax=Pseudomonas fluorescens TaxID=294 RepID=A0A0N9WM14_PSEFL|nr:MULTISPECIES: hypothetical protein [Pseudomonas]ALI03705.1 hypothetical protein AO353_22500 [Pseudomonas fluorescens]PMZ01793.1 hypothetical protein C1Y07_23520 [Pseudomonas sp. FW306-02-F02-AB]PMZ06903.1 hypothetical protein C1Y06_27395 [Pseudomonas sp. FW306-02-H06C]PMZ12754.1 hypothetical protein C1Y08_27375 [Pseudomonas sp. FW306-02-F02-AA]PMZ19412.1 hypothetical protein C1Y09_24025 [Pseudomonas sp. FW306-02-F08-AA]
MVITIKERDEHHMSHESSSAGIRMWDVFQGDVLVGVYHSEAEALKYKDLLESGRLDSHKKPPKR